MAEKSFPALALGAKIMRALHFFGIALLAVGTLVFAVVSLLLPPAVF